MTTRRDEAEKKNPVKFSAKVTGLLDAIQQLATERKRTS